MEVRRVLMLDGDAARRVATCSVLERAGYEAIGAASIHDLEAWVDENEIQLLVVEVSLPRTWDDVIDEAEKLRAFVDERCPIVLFGDRPPGELSELAWATRATSYCGPDALVGLLRRLMPATPPRSHLTTTQVGRSIPRVLLIDNSEMTLELMQTMLSPLGFDVRIAVALGEVRSIVSSWAPHVVVADVKRPELSGAELCARLKTSLGETRNVIVVLCSSIPEAELAALAEASGADGWVCKAHGLESAITEIAEQTQRLIASRARHAAS